MPFGISPVLEVDGTKLSGSVNIVRYLGIKFGKNFISQLQSYMHIHCLLLLFISMYDYNIATGDITIYTHIDTGIFCQCFISS